MAFWRASLIVVLCTVAGGAAAFATRTLIEASGVRSAAAADDVGATAILRRPPRWEYVRPLLDCRSPVRPTSPVERLRPDLERLAGQGRPPGVERVAIHLRDLGESGALDVGDPGPFELGRLALLPVMIARALHAERQPLYGAEGGDIGWGRLPDIADVDGELPALVLPVEPALLAGVARDLAWDPADPVTAAVVGRAWETLYSATYLGRGTSEDALTRLAGAPRAGIAAGVPGDRPVAHLGQDGEDCGVVYLPSRHYVLCVLTQGGTASARASVVTAVSTLVWDRLSRLAEKG